MEHQDNTLESQDKTPLIGSVLLDSAVWKPDIIIQALQNMWGMHVDAENALSEDGNILLFTTENITVSATFVGTAVPNSEAEFYAQANYLWPEAVEVTQSHVAHVIVAVMSAEVDTLDMMAMYSKMVTAVLSPDNAIAVYTGATVYEKDFYTEYSEQLKEGLPPVLLWIYVGMYRTEDGMGAYTYGMDVFGKPEMEFLNSRLRPMDLYDFMLNICRYVLTADITLDDGDTITISEEKKLHISKSDGVALKTPTLKLELR